MIPERDPQPSRPASSSAAPIIGVIIVAVIAGALWFFNKPSAAPSYATISSTATNTVGPSKPRPAPLPAFIERAPDIPQAPEPVADVIPAEPLPTLAQSDEFTRNVLAALNDSEEFALWLHTDNLIQKSVAFMDGLSRGDLMRKVLPIKPPAGKFAVIREDDRMWLDEGNFTRFNKLTALLTSIPPDTLYQVFHTLRPLFESGFSELGYPAAQMDNSLIAGIDQILAAPQLASPIALKSESVAYTFADPSLEALPPLHKQMVRIGGKNQQKVNAYLIRLRKLLLAEKP